MRTIGGGAARTATAWFAPIPVGRYASRVRRRPVGCRLRAFGATRRRAGGASVPLRGRGPRGSRSMDRVPMTRAGYEKLEQELRQLKSVERPRIVREIETARAHGDISENAEFHAAKERQSHLEGRVRLLEDRLARAQVIDTAGQVADKVRFGVTVDHEDVESGERVTYTILGEEE